MDETIYSDTGDESGTHRLLKKYNTIQCLKTLKLFRNRGSKADGSVVRPIRVIVIDKTSKRKSERRGGSDGLLPIHLQPLTPPGGCPSPQWRLCGYV
ncbi:hypothetical protein E2C01_050201 [Portunus trituberculatus]|uniref:Uncharacterized protein n=1 Tax=Portunus trituberculatus TaxID=210409 RepID=A0A5B7GGN6_PORTR|nr:hypothetical protein [Portunus trituberculatus]